MSTHICFSVEIRKNNVYPCKLHFYYIKWDLTGSRLYRYVFACFDIFDEEIIYK